MLLASVQRTETRFDVNLTATVEQFGGLLNKEYAVRNLATKGACRSGVTKLRAGQTTVISIGNQDAVAASVRWVVGGRAGIKFVQPVDIDELSNQSELGRGAK